MRVQTHTLQLARTMLFLLVHRAAPHLSSYGSLFDPPKKVTGNHHQFAGIFFSPVFATGGAPFKDDPLPVIIRAFMPTTLKGNLGGLKS